jgi:hypothetical protein
VNLDKAFRPAYWEPGTEYDQITLHAIGQVRTILSPVSLRVNATGVACIVIGSRSMDRRR